MRPISRQLGDIAATWRSFFGFTLNLACLIILFVLSFGSGCDSEKAIMHLAESTPGLKISSKEREVLKIICTSEEGLRIAGNNASSIDRPVYLSIHECTVSSEHLSPLSSLDFLRVLFVRCDFAADAFDSLADVNRLDYLSFLECSVTDEHLAPLGEATNFKRLSIVDCLQFDGTMFLDWEINQQMTDVSFTRSGVVDQAIPGIVSSFPNLLKCSLKGTRVTEEGFMQLAALPRLKPGFPENLAPDMDERIKLLKEYNRRFIALHPGSKPPYSFEFFTPRVNEVPSARSKKTSDSDAHEIEIKE